MAREVNREDTYLSRLLKNIPSEIIATYLALEGLLKSQTMGGKNEVLLWIVFGILLIATPFWMIYVEQVKRAIQIVFATLSFIIWILVMGGPVKASFEGYDTIIGSILLIIFTVVIFPIASKIWDQ